MEDIYSGLIGQHDLANILNISQMFIKVLQQPAKQHGLVGKFPIKQKGNKEAYDYIDDFIHRLKEDIGEHIATRYVRYITVTTTIYYNNWKVFLSHHTSKHQYYAQWCFDRGSIVTEKLLGKKIYTSSSEYEPRPFNVAWPEGSTILTLRFGGAGAINLLN